MRRVLLVSVLMAALLLSMLPVAAPVAAGAGNTVSGTVLDSEGQPAEGAAVTAWGSDSGVKVNNSTADSDGNYSMSVPDGVYDFTFSYADHSLKTIAGISVTSDETLNANLQKPDRYSLSGKVEFGYDTGLRDVTVTLSPVEDPFPTVETVTGEDGAFVFEDVPGGVYNISLQRDGYIQWVVPEKIVLDRNKTLSQVLTMAPAFGNVEGRVHSGDFDLSDARIKLIDEDGEVLMETRSGSGGLFEFEENIPTGDYVLRVERSGYEPAEKDIRVEADETTVVEFDLERSERPAYLFAQDLPHTLMFVGMLLSFLFLGAALLLRRKVQEDPSILYLADDEDEL